MSQRPTKNALQEYRVRNRVGEHRSIDEDSLGFLDRHIDGTNPIKNITKFKK